VLDNIDIIQYHYVWRKCSVILTRQFNTDGSFFIYSPIRKQEPVGYYAHLRSQFCVFFINSWLCIFSLYFGLLIKYNWIFTSIFWWSLYRNVWSMYHYIYLHAYVNFSILSLNGQTSFKQNWICWICSTCIWECLHAN